jgi:hypothetical protein
MEVFDNIHDNGSSKSSYILEMFDAQCIYIRRP